MLRLFLAVDVPAPAQQSANALGAKLHGARVVPLHQLHVTLRFMGQTPDDALPVIDERLTEVRSASFALRLQGVGTFPPGARRARVLWLGLEPRQPLVELAHDIDRRLGDLGLRPEEKRRMFAPHLTLARFARKPDDMTQFLTQHAEFRTPDWKVECFRLYRSQLQASGAIHQVLATYPLGSICREI